MQKIQMKIMQFQNKNTCLYKKNMITYLYIQKDGKSSNKIIFCRKLMVDEN